MGLASYLEDIVDRTGYRSFRDVISSQTVPSRRQDEVAQKHQTAEYATRKPFHNNLPQSVVEPLHQRFLEDRVPVYLWSLLDCAIGRILEGESTEEVADQVLPQILVLVTPHSREEPTTPWVRRWLLGRV